MYQSLTIFNQHYLLPIVLIISVFCVRSAFADEVKAEIPLPYESPVALAIENSWPPYADAEGHGLSRQLVTAAYNAVDIHPEFWVLPYARVLLEIASGRVAGGMNVTRQQSTESRFIFGHSPLLSAEASFYFRAGEGKSYQSIRDLPDNTRVGLIIDYEYGDDFEHQRARFNEVRVSGQTQLIKMLIKGRIDTAIMFDRVAGYTLQQIPDAQDRINQGMHNHTSDIYVAFSRKHPEGQMMADALDQGLNIIRANGVYQSILEQY